MYITRPTYFEMTVLKYLREGILVMIYCLICCAFAVINTFVVIYNFFRFKKAAPKIAQEDPIAEPLAA